MLQQLKSFTNVWQAQSLGAEVIVKDQVRMILSGESHFIWLLTNPCEFMCHKVLSSNMSTLHHEQCKHCVYRLMRWTAFGRNPCFRCTELIWITCQWRIIVKLGMLPDTDECFSKVPVCTYCYGSPKAMIFLHTYLLNIRYTREYYYLQTSIIRFIKRRLVYLIQTQQHKQKRIVRHRVIIVGPATHLFRPLTDVVPNRTEISAIA